MNNKKTIDVIIPTFNNGIYILKAIESVQKQTLKPQNIIIIDDGSIDNTEEIINKYKKTSEIPITYIKKKNGGPNSARNIGILLSKSYYLAFLDSDDTWDEKKLEEQVKLFNKNNNLGLIYCSYDLIDSNDKKTNGKIVNIDKNFQGNAYEFVIKSNKILGSASAVLIKKEVFSNVGLFDENLRFAEDWDMWIRISRKYEIDYSEKAIVHIRKHGNNTSNNFLKNIIGEIEFYNKWVPILDYKNIPIEWRTRLLGQIILRLPKLDFINLITKNLNKKVYKSIFPNIFSYLSIIPIIFKKIIKKMI
jgi:glycosyltransferase involved in cell wall biosynthesis